MLIDFNNLTVFVIFEDELLAYFSDVQLQF